MIDGIGQRIKQRRQELGMSQSEISNMTELSSGNLSKLEAGVSIPSAQALIKLAKVLECSIDWLLLGNNLLGNKEPVNPPLLEDYVKKFKMLDQKNQEEIVEIIKIKLRMGKEKK